MRFTTTVLLGGKTATGLVVPDAVVEALGAGRRPAVVVTVGGHSYPSTVAAMGGQFLVPLSAENRTAAGVAAGDEVEAEIVVDTSSRRVEPPPDLAEALGADEAARDLFETLSPTHRKEWVRWVEEAKKPETRATRVTRTVEALREGRRTR